MLTTKQAVLRRFWYAVMPVHHLADGPRPFRLMGEDLVLFLDAGGAPRALRDRCCHRTAKLSKGWCAHGEIVCGYHGWRYDGQGRLTEIPQLGRDAPLPACRVQSFRCQTRYGYAWVALDDPIADIFDIPEDRDPAFRRIFQFYDTWRTAPLRLMENSFDNAHFSYVHRGTFGDITQPRPKFYDIAETDYGFYATTVVDILNPPDAVAITGDPSPTTTRTMHNHWYMPFCRRMDMAYPSGIRHIIINCATPIEDDRIQLVQLLYRNDREEDCPAERLIAWDRKITDEDREILEATDCDATLDITRQVESHMPSDRPGLIMRRRLLDLLRRHGEDEITRPPPPSATPPAMPGPDREDTIPMIVDDVRNQAERVLSLRLRPADGAELPPFAPGAHVALHVAPGLVRHYSLCSDPQDRAAWRIAVLLEAASRGGSATVHGAFRPGRQVRVGLPRNHFPLADAPFVVLIAGGIGITPLLPMALELHRAGRPFALHVCAHSRRTAPFLDEALAAPYAAHVTPHLAAEGGRLDVPGVLAAAPEGAHVQVCGPLGLQDAVAAAARALGWDGGRVHAERFTADVDIQGRPFMVRAERSNVTVEIPADRSIAQALGAAGISIPVSCEQGLCGTCVTRVLEGEPDHRDLFLSEADKARGTHIMACCSRARGACLVLDL